MSGTVGVDVASTGISGVTGRNTNTVGSVTVHIVGFATSNRFQVAVAEFATDAGRKGHLDLSAFIGFDELNLTGEWRLVDPHLGESGRCVFQGKGPKLLIGGGFFLDLSDQIHQGVGSIVVIAHDFNFLMSVFRIRKPKHILRHFHCSWCVHSFHHQQPPQDQHR